MPPTSVSNGVSWKNYLQKSGCQSFRCLRPSPCCWSFCRRLRHLGAKMLVPTRPIQAKYWWVRWVWVKIPPQHGPHGCAWNLRPTESGALLQHPENIQRELKEGEQEESSTNPEIFCVPFDVAFSAQLWIGQNFTCKWRHNQLQKSWGCLEDLCNETDHDVTLNNHMILQETSWNNMQEYEALPTNNSTIRFLLQVTVVDLL